MDSSADVGSAEPPETFGTVCILIWGQIKISALDRTVLPC